MFRPFVSALMCQVAAVMVTIRTFPIAQHHDADD